jgi:hypothetical protein
MLPVNKLFSRYLKLRGGRKRKEFGNNYAVQSLKIFFTKCY